MSVYLTWEQLAEAIQQMPPERRGDPVQMLWYSNEDPIPLMAAFHINMVDYYSRTQDGDPMPNYTRGVLDNQHHPEHYVLLIDENHFSEEGDTYYTLTDEGMVGNKTGKLY